MWGRILIAAVVVLVVAVLCHLAIKAIQRLLALESVSLSQTSIVVNIVRIVVWGVAICFIADVCFDVNMTAVIAALGVGGIAISLGFQNLRWCSGNSDPCDQARRQYPGGYESRGG